MSKKNPTTQELCIKLGVKCYPVYQGNDVFIDGKLIYAKDNWYLEVDNNGSKKKYAKSVHKGKILNGDKIEEAVEKVYESWIKIINKK